MRNEWAGRIDLKKNFFFFMESRSAPILKISFLGGFPEIYFHVSTWVSGRKFAREPLGRSLKSSTKSLLSHPFTLHFLPSTLTNFPSKSGKCSNWQKERHFNKKKKKCDAGKSLNWQQAQWKSGNKRCERDWVHLAAVPLVHLKNFYLWETGWLSITPNGFFCFRIPF